MSYRVTLYRINDDPRKLEKQLIDSGGSSNRVAYYDVNFRKTRSLLTQQLSLQIPATPTVNYQNHFRVNYILVTSANAKRTYYFVDNVEMGPTGDIRYTLREDVLYTWASELKALTVTLDRSETIFNGYLPDSEYSALGYRTIAAKMFPNGLTNDNCILITTG